MYNLKGKIIIFFIIFFLFFTIEKTFAATNTWEFDLSTDYTLSNSTSFDFSSSIASLKRNTLTHIGSATTATNLDGAYDVVVDGNYAYVTSNVDDKVSIYDVSNPSAPTFVSQIVNNAGTIRLDGAASLVKDGNYLYVASQVSDALQIINVTNPLAPVAAGQILNTATTQLNGARGIDIDRVNKKVYIASDTSDGLTVINVLNPAAPAYIGKYRVNNGNLNGAYDVKISGNYAFVTSLTNDAFSVLDITTANPTYITQLIGNTTFDGAWGLDISGNYAYVSSSVDSAVRVVDISIPTAPVIVANILGGSYSLAGTRYLFVEGNYLFVTSFTDDAINVVDISNPLNPTYVTKIIHNAANPLLNGATGLFKLGDYIYVSGVDGDSLEILKFEYDKTSPSIIPNTGFNYGILNSINSFSATLGAGNQGSVTYQVSKDNGVTWYYWDGSAWTTTVAGVANSSNVTIINTNLSTFNALSGGTGIFKFKAFFTSNGDQSVELDNVILNTSDPASPGGVSTGIQVWLKANKGTSTTISGNPLATWNDQSSNGFDATSGVSPIYLNDNTNNLNYNPLVDFDGTQYLENLNNGAYSQSYFMVVVPDNQIDGTLTGQVPFGLDAQAGTPSGGGFGLPFGGTVLGAFTAAINDEVITHALGSSVDWRSAEIGAVSYEANKPLLIGVNENSGANGNDIYEKGLKVDNFTANTYQTISATDYRLGRSLDAANPFSYNGKIAEVINYNSRISDIDRQKIESYLSLKYGMTLNLGIQNYVASDGVTNFWSTSLAGVYINDIFGIARDDLSSLGQVKSKSVNSDSVITLEAVGEGTNLTPSFIDIDDLESLTIANNDLGNTWSQTDVPVGYYNLSRKWKTQEIGEVGTINLNFDVDSLNFDIPVLSLGTNYYFTYDSNNNNSLSDETPLIMTNITGSIWQISGINLNNDVEFTISTQASTNNIPTNITISNNSVAENSIVGTFVGSFSSVDLDLVDTHTYSLVSGSGDGDNSLFSISGNSLLINGLPDYEIDNSYSIRIQTDDGNGGQFQKIFTINITNVGEVTNSIIDFENIEDENKYTITSGSWTRTGTNSQEGTLSIESQNNGQANTQTCFEIINTFTDIGTVEFQYNVSSQAGGDFLRFYMDNIEQNAWSGTVPWTLYSDNTISAGTHSYKWCYIKDGATNTGSDKAWVDYITFNDVSTDTTPPTISSINYASGTLFPGGNHNLIINYSDLESGINTSSDIITLNKWNGTVWGTDISASGLNLGSKIITSTSATYSTNNLEFGKYRYNFSISDNNGNTSSTGAVFYIDEPELIISTGSLDIGNLTNGVTKFSDLDINVTVKTVGAGFSVLLNKDTPLSYSTAEIIDWNGTEGVGFEQTPYTSTINLVNIDQVLATEISNINIDGDKNIYIYTIRFGALIGEEQAAGIYSSNIRFGLNLDY